MLDVCLYTCTLLLSKPWAVLLSQHLRRLVCGVLVNHKRSTVTVLKFRHTSRCPIDFVFTCLYCFGCGVLDLGCLSSLPL